MLTLLLLLGGELAVRARALLRHGQAGPQTDIFVDDAALGRIARPGATMTSAGATTTINRWGLRGPDFAMDKPAGTLRVLCLGESTTFGQPHDDDLAIWPALLERLLCDAGGRFEVLNGALPGCTVQQSRAAFELRLARFEPDIVIILHAATNIAAHGRRQSGSNPTEPNTPPTLAAMRDRHSLAFMLMRANTASLLATQFPATRHRRLDDAGFRAFEDNLDKLVGACLARNCGVVLCTFPRAFDDSQPSGVRNRLAGSALFFNPRLSVVGLIDAYDRYNATIRRLAERHGLPLVDLDRAIPRGDADFVDSVHFSPEGHERVAREIARVLRDHLENSAGASAGSVADAVQ